MGTTLRCIAACLVSIITCAPPLMAEDWKEGDTVHMSVDISRLISSGEIDRMRQAGLGIPYERLDKPNTSDWWRYKSKPFCGTMSILKVKDDSAKGIVVGDGILRFRLRGAWEEYAHRDRNACRTETLVLMKHRLKVRHGPYYNLHGDVLTFVPKPSPEELAPFMPAPRKQPADSPGAPPVE